MPILSSYDRVAVNCKLLIVHCLSLKKTIEIQKKIDKLYPEVEGEIIEFKSGD